MYSKLESFIIYEEIARIQQQIAAIKTNKAVFWEVNFNLRADTIDLIDFHILAWIESLPETKDNSQYLNLLRKESDAVKHELEKLNADLISRLRTEIMLGRDKTGTFREIITKYQGKPEWLIAETAEPGYDNLDIFINGLISSMPMPAETVSHEPEMVYFQKTPARIVFEMASALPFTQNDVFYDIGSGLGQVCILLKLISPAACMGVEYVPSYCTYAQNAASALNLNDISFTNADARNADYSHGTVFFMYTPFTGNMLEQVLSRIKQQTAGKSIHLFTYGPCTDAVAEQSWLCANQYEKNNPDRLGWFVST